MSKNINDTDLMKGIDVLLNSELERAVNKFGAFNSAHEGYGVIKEELEETLDEINQVTSDLNNLWENVKRNLKTEQCTYALMLLTDARRAAFEIIQVAAMAKRFMQDIKGK